MTDISSTECPSVDESCFIIEGLDFELIPDQADPVLDEKSYARLHFFRDGNFKLVYSEYLKEIWSGLFEHLA